MADEDKLLALFGGKPVRPQGPPSWPLPDEDILRALEAAYGDGSWGKYHGDRVERLRKRLAEYHGVEFALVCGSGTFALELALRALKIGPGDEVLMAAYDYPGNFLGIHAVGAFPVLVDVGADNWNLDPKRIEPAIGPRMKAILASHLHGGVVPMKEVCEIARGRSLKVIEDAAQMPGAIIQGRKAGTWGDAGILSFGGSKLLTAGRGGALITNHAAVYQRALLHQNRGENWVCPLSELQAAVLWPQLDKLDHRNAQRTEGVRKLAKLMEDIPGLRAFRQSLPETEPGFYKLGFQYDGAAFGVPRHSFLAVRAEGIAFDEGFRALHVGRSPNRYRAGGDLTESERAHHGAIVLHHPVLLGSDKDLEEVATAVRKVYASADKLRK